MAKEDLKHKDNQDGNFYVDNTCIDCGTCYWMAPQTFKFQGEQSIVYQQPKEENVEATYRALFSCPVTAIGAKEMGSIAHKVSQSIPYEIAGRVFHNGFHSEKSYGATSYFIQRPEGNVLIDSPRFAPKLAKSFEAMGGITLQLLTHKDDIADTDLYWERFGSTRMLHKADASGKTAKYEKLFNGEGDIAIDKDLIAIPVPGHTEGSVCFLYKNKFLFTGDHLAFSRELGHLYAFRRSCFYDFEVQIRSMKKLLNYEFEHVLPGHGSPIKADKETMRASLKKCLEWMEKNL